MGRYAAVNDLDRHLGRFKADLTATSRPSLEELPDFIAEVEDELDVTFVAAGAVTPVTAPAALVSWLRDTVAIEASSRILGTLLPMANGTLSTTRAGDLHALYLERMKRLSSDSITDITVVTAGGQLPRSYWTTNPIDEVTDEPHAPVFSMHTQW